MVAMMTDRAVQEVTLPTGVVRYRDEGSGPTLVFVHGVLANSTLWREVIPLLRGGFRCIAPDLPLGGHAYPMFAEADQSPHGVARLLADLLQALDLRDVTLVGNDTGGAICQLTITRHPERISGLVLTNCDAYEAFFPRVLSPLQHAARIFGVRFVHVLAWMLRARAVQRLLLWTVALRRMDGATLDAYFTPLCGDAGVRRDLARFLAAVSNRDTLEAARSFPGFHHPVLIVWGKNDIFFSARNAARLQRDFPQATLYYLSPSRAFVPEDQPDALTRHITEFMHGSPVA